LPALSAPGMATGKRGTAQMAGGMVAVLAHDLLVSELASFLRFKHVDRMRAASRFLQERFGPPDVPAELLEPVPCHLHIKREMTLSRLEALALRKSGRAVRAIVSRLGDEDEYDHLRSWTLSSLRQLAEPGDAWAISAIMGPTGPLALGGTGVREQALKVLMELTDKASTGAIRAAVSALYFAEKCKDCRPLKIQGRLALEFFAKKAADIVVDQHTVTRVLMLLEVDSLETRCSALRALALIACRGDAAVTKSLLKGAARNGRELSIKERLYTVRALARVAEPDDAEALQALGSCVPEEVAGCPLRAKLARAASEALGALDGARR